MSCNDAEMCKKYQQNIGNPYNEQNPCNSCSYNMSDYDRGFEKGFRTFYDKLQDYLETHNTNQILIKEKIEEILIELTEDLYH